KAVQLRKSNEALVYGKYTLIDKDNPKVYAYTRTLNGKEFLIALNFTQENANFRTPFDLSKAKIILNNYTNASHNTTLKPYEAIVYELK
ncbi:alpha-glucosidase C-terminal domain-containing protein, partial [Acinetobacter baumannii]